MTTDKSSPLGELLAEFLGTFVLLALGDGVVAMVVLFGSSPPIPGEIVKGGYTNITLGWGLAVLMGIAVSGRISGGHLNPAVTLALAVFRDFPWSKVLPYMAAQLAGAFAGAALVYLNYQPAFLQFDPELSKSVTVFATAPAFPDAWAYGLIDQIVGTALLVGLVLAITEPKNLFAPPGLQPLLIALVVVAIGMSWGGMHGYAINPARDLGPRLFTLVAGFQNTGFANGVYLIPIVGPLLGGLLGALVYDRMIRPYIPVRAESPQG
jgi:glycerol uptake facilitator protein